MTELCNWVIKITETDSVDYREYLTDREIATIEQETELRDAQRPAGITILTKIK
jgi:hypothetical protein